MNGDRYFLDTNAIIALLAGDMKVAALVKGASYIGTSIICELEFLVGPELAEAERRIFMGLLSPIQVVDVRGNDAELMSDIERIRRRRGKIKLPDAIVLASAASRGCVLITRDRQLLDVEGCPAVTF